MQCSSPSSQGFTMSISSCLHPQNLRISGLYGKIWSLMSLRQFTCSPHIERPLASDQTASDGLLWIAEGVHSLTGRPLLEWCLEAPPGVVWRLHSEVEISSALTSSFAFSSEIQGVSDGSSYCPPPSLSLTHPLLGRSLLVSQEALCRSGSVNSGITWLERSRRAL